MLRYFVCHLLPGCVTFLLDILFQKPGCLSLTTRFCYRHHKNTAIVSSFQTSLPSPSVSSASHSAASAVGNPSSSLPPSVSPSLTTSASEPATRTPTSQTMSLEASVVAQQPASSSAHSSSQSPSLSSSSSFHQITSPAADDSATRRSDAARSRNLRLALNLLSISMLEVVAPPPAVPAAEMYAWEAKRKTDEDFVLWSCGFVEGLLRVPTFYSIFVTQTFMPKVVYRFLLEDPARWFHPAPHINTQSLIRAIPSMLEASLVSSIEVADLRRRLGRAAASTLRAAVFDINDCIAGLLLVLEKELTAASSNRLLHSHLVAVRHLLSLSSSS